MSDDPVEPCQHCMGTGKEFPNCPTCEGMGWIEDDEYGGTMNCPECDNEDCSVCGGEGHVWW